MAIAEKHIDEIVALYDGGNGDTVSDIAKAYPALTKAAITYHLKKRGVFVSPGATMQSDEDLGIGEEDTPAIDLNAMLANPALAKLIDAAVTARMAQLATPSATAPPASSEAFTAFTETLKHLIDAQALQQPGYMKPLPADELDRRGAGQIEMRALLESYQKAQTPPLWQVGDGGFFECTNAMEFAPGDKIRTYLPPPEDFVPLNAEARNVHAALMRWLGTPTASIGEQVEKAMREANQAPLVGRHPDRDDQGGSGGVGRTSRRQRPAVAQAPRHGNYRP